MSLYIIMKPWGQLVASTQCLEFSLTLMVVTCECCAICGSVLGLSVLAAVPSSLGVEEADRTL